MIFCFWSCEKLEICAKMKIVNFVAHSVAHWVRSSICQTTGAARVQSYNFLCSISLYRATNYKLRKLCQFLSKLKARKTNRALRLYANCMVFDITRVNRNLPLLLCTFGRSFERKKKKIVHEMNLKNSSSQSTWSYRHYWSKVRKIWHGMVGGRRSYFY